MLFSYLSARALDWLIKFSTFYFLLLISKCLILAILDMLLLLCMLFYLVLMVG